MIAQDGTPLLRRSRSTAASPSRVRSCVSAVFDGPGPFGEKLREGHGAIPVHAFGGPFLHDGLHADRVSDDPRGLPRTSQWAAIDAAYAGLTRPGTGADGMRTSQLSDTDVARSAHLVSMLNEMDSHDPDFRHDTASIVGIVLNQRW